MMREGLACISTDTTTLFSAFFLFHADDERVMRECDVRGIFQERGALGICTACFIWLMKLSKGFPSFSPSQVPSGLNKQEHLE